MTPIAENAQIIGMGLLGITLIVFVKINDITSVNPNLSFWQTAGVFMKQAMASYLASITALFNYAFTKESWINK